jgi:hypothetical protein
MGPTTARVFVLGAALLLGCPTEEPAGHEEGASSSSSSSSETTSIATSSSGTTGDGDTGETTRGDGTTTTSSPPSTTAADEGSTSSSDTSDTSGTTGEPTSACQQGCAVEVSCTMDWQSEDECVSACEANLVRAAVFSPTCADAWESLSECLGTLICEEFLEWRMPTMFPYPCVEADEGLQFECKGQ